MNDLRFVVYEFSGMGYSRKVTTMRPLTDTEIDYMKSLLQEFDATLTPYDVYDITMNRMEG